MNENVKALLAAVDADPELRERLSKMAVGELVAAAKEKGIELTEEDLRPAAGEVGESDLENVAGGGLAFCLVAGFGLGTDSEDGKSYTCGCVGYGQGGDGRMGDANCVCFVGGEGEDNHDWFYIKK